MPDPIESPEQFAERFAASMAFLGEYFGFPPAPKRRPGRPAKIHLPGIDPALKVPRKGAHGPPRKYDDATVREWIAVIEFAKEHFGVLTEKAAVERIEEELRREAGGSNLRKRRRIAAVIKEISRARTRLNINLRLRRPPP